MKALIIFCFVITLSSCTFDFRIPPESKSPQMSAQLEPKLTLQQAESLAQLPLSCAEVEYPNKLNQVIGSDQDLQSPKELHPSFYGCFDWHSAVHGHWSMVFLLKQFPKIRSAEKMKAILRTNITAIKVKKEVEYFHGKHNKSWERTYGWAWLLKLAEELHTWDDPIAKELEQNLKPLTDLLVDKYKEFLPKLIYPIRVGEHTNTAFGLAFAYDYALTLENYEFAQQIEKRAKDYYFEDSACPLAWEPSGFDFLSPCFEELNLMSKVLSKDEFLNWSDAFLVNLSSRYFELQPAQVSDRSDGKLVHLDGLNFSRAWVLYPLARLDSKFSHLKNIADEHMNFSLPNLVGDSYEGGHWLASFALYALKKKSL